MEGTLADQDGPAADRRSARPPGAGRHRRARTIAAGTALAAAGVVVALAALFRDVTEFTWGGVRGPGARPSSPAAAAGPTGAAVPASSPPAVAATFVLPTAGGVPNCTPVAGTVSGLTGDRAAWLLVKGPDTEDLYYLTYRIAPTTHGAPNWSAGNVQIGSERVPGKTFDLLIIGTEGAETAEYARKLRLREHWVTLPPRPRVLDTVPVTVTDAKDC
jgi:hypothetical protein